MVQLTLLLTQATLVWFDLRLSMVSSMLTAIVTVVGVATVVHIIVRFRQAALKGMSQRAALMQTGTHPGGPDLLGLFDRRGRFSVADGRQSRDRCGILA